MTKSNDKPNAKTEAKSPEMIATEKKLAEKKAAKLAKRAAAKAAKAILAKYMETKEYKALPAEVQAAIKLVAVKTRSVGSDSLKADFIQLWKKIGDRVHEFDVFKKFKYGRSEVRKRIRYINKGVENVADIFALDFDEEKEEWVRVKPVVE